LLKELKTYRIAGVMSSQWDSRRIVKFSRDDNQIFALNYENLCDIEYLSKLFVSESQVDPEQLSSHPWLLTPDLPEDILIFGRHCQVGLEFIYQRSLFDDSSQSRLLDSHADVILRQVKVFAHIGKMILLKCREIVETTSLLDEISLGVGLSLGSDRSVLFLPDALTCALQVIKVSSSKKFFSRSSLNSIVSLISESFQGCINDSTSSGMKFHISPIHAHLLRFALCEGMRPLAARERSSVEAVDDDFVQALKLSMSCAMCLYKLGLFSQSSSDVLLSMAHMLAVSICVDDLKGEADEQNTTRETVIQAQGKNRLRGKNHDNRFKSKRNALLPQQSNDQVSGSEGVTGFDIKIGTEKSSWQKPILKSAAGKGWKEKLCIKKLSTDSRPERDRGNVSKQCGRLNLSVTPAADSPLVSTWRCSTDSARFTRRIKPCTSSKTAAPSKVIAAHTGGPVQQTDVESRHFQRKASSSLEYLNVIPKDLIKEVNKYCIVSKDTASKTMCDTKGVSDSCRSMSTTAIWTCGQNSYGELGHGDVNLRRSFAKSVFFDDKSISCVGAGNEHSVFISSSGKTYVAGYNDNGQCGIGTTQQVRQPTVVAFLEDEDISNVFVFNGCEHTLVVTTDGKMFSFGYNYRGQLGVGNTCSEPVPRPIGGLMSRKVALAACSYHHSIVTCVDGSVFSFGRNDCGQLGNIL
jgi:hypothetical protein